MTGVFISTREEADRENANLEKTLKEFDNDLIKHRAALTEGLELSFKVLRCFIGLKVEERNGEFGVNPVPLFTLIETEVGRDLTDLEKEVVLMQTAGRLMAEGSIGICHCFPLAHVLSHILDNKMVH